MEFRVLGPLEVVDDDGSPVGLGGARRRLVLASLLIRAGEAVSVERIATDVWGDEIPYNPKSAVQVAISRLRGAVGPDRIQSRGSGYLLRVGPDEFDAEAFEELFLEAQRAADRGQGESARELCDRGLRLWRGEPYDEFAFEDFAQGEIRRLAELRSALVDLRLRTLVDSGRTAEALPEIEGQIADDPLREGLWALYMLALYRGGRQADALRAYRRAAEVLGEELGIEPGRELRELEERILLQDDRLDIAESPSEELLPEGEVTFVIADAAAAMGAGSEPTTAFEIFDAAAHREGGFVFRATADQHLAVFAEPAAATHAALDAQVALAEPTLAMGIHTTTARLRDGDYVGLGVSKALRLAVGAAPGQILLTAAAATASREGFREDATLRELAARLLPGLSAPEAVSELRHPDMATIAVVAAAHTNLPAADMSSFVGRSLELREIEKLLGDYRLVTLTGPGGVGKTRLALQAASDQVGRHGDGVWLAQLAAVDTSDLAVVAIAEALQVDTESGDALDTVKRALVDHKTLLVLDNCEHLVDEIAEMLERLLPAASGLRVLATSRERLGVAGERVFQVPRLAVPAEGVDLEELEGFEAVQLFSTRASELVPEFILDADNAEAVLRICRRLDGIPLAIELAAGHLQLLQAGEIADKLEAGFELLDTVRRRGRRETLGATIDWSYRLLADEEQEALRACAVFEGGFDLDAAEAVCGSAAGSPSTVAAIAGLVRKSLLVARGDSAKTRYEMLQTIRGFAIAHLDPHELRTFRQAHALHYSNLAADVAVRIESADAAEALAACRRDSENLRAGLAWLVANDPESAVAMFANLAFFLSIGLAGEGARVASDLFETYGGEASPELAAAKKVAGNMAFSSGDIDGALQLWEESAAVFDTIGDTIGSARTLNNVAILMISAQDRVAEGAALLRQAMELLPADVEAWLRLSFVGNLAAAEFKLGNLEVALHEMEEHLLLSRREELPGDVARTLGNMGLTLWCLGRLDEAKARVVEAIESCRSLGDEDLLAEPLKVLAEVHIAEGDLGAAAVAAAEALDLRIATHQGDLVDYIETVGELAIARSDIEEGIRLIAAARVHKGRDDFTPMTPEEEARQALVLEAIGQLADGVDAEWRRGAGLSERAALQLAREVLMSVGE